MALSISQIWVEQEAKERHSLIIKLHSTPLEQHPLEAWTVAHQIHITHLDPALATRLLGASSNQASEDFQAQVKVLVASKTMLSRQIKKMLSKVYVIFEIYVKNTICT